MKNTKMLILFLLFIFLLPSCRLESSPYNTAVRFGIEIPTAAHAEISEAYESALALLRAGEVADDIVMFIDQHPNAAEESETASSMAESPVDEPSAKPELYPAHPVAFSPKYTLTDVVQPEGSVIAEYLVTFGKNVAEPQRIDAGDDTAFAFELSPYACEVYVAFTTFERGQITYLLCSVFENTEDSGWQLCELRCGEYAYEGLTAPQLYERAQELAAAKQIVPTAVYAYCAGQVLNPCGIVWRENESIAGGVAPLFDAVNKQYRFPYDLPLMEREDIPQNRDLYSDERFVLLGFDPVVTREHGISVVVKYMTNNEIFNLSLAQAAELDEDGIPIVDGKPLTERQIQQNERTQEKLVAEQQDMLQWLGRDFAGLDEAFVFVQFAAYNREEWEPEEEDKISAPTPPDKTLYRYFFALTNIDAEAAKEGYEE